ncbi:hypothetical protein [Solimonas marina]|uniref:Uncharacterized protein n=1 Tax=Solimonas marina TaxID=2714601 RepID=A0A969W717_9GAMM|nr:hypothetical protein [Solimonas marina]NKF21582.1 hypothetical protein [Solimonas marina]
MADPKKKGALKVSVVSMPKSENAISSGPDKWQIEEDMRTLLRAQEVRRDPKRFKAAKKLASERLQEMKAAFGSADSK